jgi:hypothetical protein
MDKESTILKSLEDLEAYANGDTSRVTIDVVKIPKK